MTIDIFAALQITTLSSVEGMVTAMGMFMQLTPMDILALCVTIAGEMKKPMLCAGWRKLFFLLLQILFIDN